MNGKIATALSGAAMIGLVVLTGGSPARAYSLYSGFDDGQAAPIGPNSAAAQASFLSAAGPVTTVTFESAIPSSVTISGSVLSSAVRRM